MKTYAFLLLALVATLFTSCKKEELPCGCGGNGNNGTGGQPPAPINLPAGHALVWSKPANGNFGPNVVPPAIPLDLNGDVYADVNGFCQQSAGGNELHIQIQNTYDYYRNQYHQYYGYYPSPGTTYVEVTYIIIPNAEYYTGADLFQITGIVQ